MRIDTKDKDVEKWCFGTFSLYGKSLDSID